MPTNWKSIDYSRIEVVSFDLGYTVIGPNYLQITTFISRIFSVYFSPAVVMLADERMRKGLAVSDNTPMKIGNEHFSTVLAALVTELDPYLGQDAHNRTIRNFADACRAYHDDRNFFEIVYPDALSALRLLKRHDIRTVAISNAHGTLERDMDRLGLAPYFEYVLDSSVEGVAKPDPEIFVRAMDRCGVKAENFLHVGDNPIADVAGALRVGMQAALYDPTGMYPDANGRAPQYRNHVDLAQRIITAQS